MYHFVSTGRSQKPNIALVLGIAIPLIVLAAVVIFFVLKGRKKGYHREVFVDVAGMGLFWVDESVKHMLSWILDSNILLQDSFHINFADDEHYVNTKLS